MQRVLVWDLPVRLFHWALAIAFGAAFAIATIGGDDSPIFPLHALLGMFAVLLLVLRIVWGVTGSRWSRFESMDFRPGSLVSYGRRVFGTEAAQHAGHNPATTWFMVAIFILFAGLGATGFALGLGRESVKEVHEVLAWTTLVVAAVHVAGVVWHRVRTRECLAVSMVTGYKQADAADSISSARPWSAVALVVIALAFASALAAGYDRQTRRLDLAVLPPLQLGEIEEEGEAESQASGDEHEAGEGDSD